jgi:hypothetical protein
VEISDELSAAWENVDDENHFYVVATLDSLASQAAGAIPPGVPLTPDTLGKLTAATVTANLDKKQISVSATLNCTDNTTATQLKSLFDVVVMGTLQQGANTPDEAKQVLRTVKASVEDESFEISFDVGLDIIVKQIKAQVVPVLPAATKP